MSSQTIPRSPRPSGTSSRPRSAGHRTAARRLLPLGLAAAALALFAAPGRADSLNAFNDPALFGTLNQNTVGFIGDSACSPTSVVNSFVFLEQKYPTVFGRSLVPDTNGNNAYDQDEMKSVALVLAGADYMHTTTASGTQDGYMAYGMQKYMEEKAAGKTSYTAAGDTAWDGPAGQQPSWYQASTVPTIDFLFSALSGAFDVEVGVTWTSAGESGGHWITAYGLVFDTLTKVGTLSFIDPWLAVQITGDLSILQNGKLQLTYTGGAAEAKSLTSTIDIVVAEGPAPVIDGGGNPDPSPVPEPTVVVLLGPGLLTLLVVRRRAKAATAAA